MIYKWWRGVVDCSTLSGWGVKLYSTNLLYTVPGYYLNAWLQAGKPFRYVTSHLGQLSLLSIWGR